jgi:MFS family permease
VPPSSSSIRRELVNRNLAILVAAQAVAVTGTVALVTLGGIIGRDLAPTPGLATLPLSLMVLGTAAATVFAAWLMARTGRRIGFCVGALLGCLGAVGGGWAVVVGDFAGFCVASALVGTAMAFSAQYRFAAAESVSAEAAGYAVSCTLAGSLLGALIGPELAARGEFWLDAGRFAGTFVGVALCYVTAALLLLGLRAGAPAAASTSDEPTRPIAEIMRSRTFAAAVLGGAAGYGVMVFVMTAAPLAMHAVDGHSLRHTAGVVQAHVLAMYAPSLVAGALIARWGADRTMLLGALVLGLTVCVGFLGREVMHYAVAMVALGVGWNFLYTGGTTLLGLAHTSAERFRAQAVNDLAVFSTSAAASLAAGAVMQIYGWNAVLGVSAPVIVAALAALVMLRRGRTGLTIAG